MFSIIGAFKQNSVFEHLINESGPYLVPNSADGSVAAAMISIERVITLLPGDGSSTPSWNNNASLCRPFEEAFKNTQWGKVKQMH